MSLHTQSVDQRVTLTIAGTPLECGEDGWRHCMRWQRGVVPRKSSVRVHQRCGTGSGEEHTHPLPSSGFDLRQPLEESSHFSAKGT